MVSRIVTESKIVFLITGFVLGSTLTWFMSEDKIVISKIPVEEYDINDISELTRMIKLPNSNSATKNDISINSSRRRILLDCGGNMASTVSLFRETYPGGKEYIIHSFEIDDRLAPYFAPYENHYLHCPLGVSDVNGSMVAYSESAWAPDKGMNNGLDMQWGGGTLYVDKEELKNKDTGGRRKLNYRKKIPTVDLSTWIQKNTKKEDYVIFKLDVEGAEFKILQKMLKDGTFDWIDKYYGEYHLSQPVGIDKKTKMQIIEEVKKKSVMLEWAGEYRRYEDFEELHPVRVPMSVRGTAGITYSECNTPKHISLIIEIGMSRKQAIKTMSILASYKVKIPVTVFVYSEFAEEWPEIVQVWSEKYTIGLRGNHPYPSKDIDKMSFNWIREDVVSAEMRLNELGIFPAYFINSFEDNSDATSVLKERGFRLIKPKSNFPPKSNQMKNGHIFSLDFWRYKFLPKSSKPMRSKTGDPILNAENYYNFRDVERVPKALRVINEQLKDAHGGILSLDSDLPDTYMILVFFLDYLVENSGFKLVSLEACIG